MSEPVLLNVRNGLPCAAAKIRRGPLRVAYIGGSNTVAVEGWRPRIHQWFNETFPVSGGHTEINLSIGAIGSLAASFQIPVALKDKKPDLAFIEYSVNDFNWMSWEGGLFGRRRQSPASVSASTEGIIRMVKRENPDCDIFLIYMPLLGQMTGQYKWINDAVVVSERLANHYGLPSLFSAAGFRDFEASGRVSPADYPSKLFRDDAHLSLAEGLVLFHEQLTGSLTQLLRDTTGKTAPLPNSLNPLTTEFAQPLPISPDMIDGPFEHLRFKNSRFDQEYYSLPVGTKLHVAYQGVPVGFGILFGPETPGAVRGVFLGQEEILNTFTSYCGKQHLGSLQFNKDLSIKSSGTDVMMVEALPDLPDYSKYPQMTPQAVSALRLNLTYLMILGESLNGNFKAQCEVRGVLR